MGTTGAIKTIKSGNSIVLPVTSSHAVLLNETHPDTIPGNTLAAKLGEIDNSLGKKQDKLTTIGDLSIYQSDNSTGYVIQHNNSLGTEVGKETQLQIFDIDKHGHITNRRNATPEDLAKTGTAFLRFVGNYNPDINYSYGDICVINGYEPSDMSLEDGDFIIMGTTGKWSSWQANITPNIQLNNSNNRIYGTGSRTNIYAPTELGKDGEVLTTTENGLEWKTIHAPTKLGNAGYVLATNSTKNGLEWKPIPTTNVEFNSDGNKLTIGDKTISFTGGTGISVNSEKTGTTTDITVSSLYSYNKRDFTTDNNTISLRNPQEQVKLSAGNGIGIINNTVSVKLDSDSDSYLTVGENGLKLSGIESAVSKQISESINKLSGSKKGASKHVDVTVTQTGGNITGVTVAENNIVSNADLANEIKARKAVDGQSGQKYAKNTQATHIKNATSLNNADVLLSSALDAEIANRTSADANLSNKIASLQGHVDSMSASYPYITEEIWGKNHNYAWEQASRIDKLGNAFNWGLRFSDGIILAPHNNGIIVPYGTTEKIYLPKCGVCWVGYTLFSKAPITITVGGISVSLNGEQYVVNKDDENNKFYMRRVAGLKTILSEPYLTIQSSQGTTSGIDKTAYLTDIVIYFEDGSPTKQMQLQESINTITKSSRYVNSWDQDNNNSNIFLERFENLSQGFYQLTYSVQGTSVTPSITTDGEKYCVIASLLYPINTMTEGVFNIRNNGSYFTNRNFYTKDCKVHHDIITTTNSNNINNFNYTTFQTIYYLPESGTTTLYLRTWNKGTFTVENVSLKPIQWSDTINNSIINSSTINNPFLNLISQNSNLYNRIIEDGGKQYIQLVYEVDGVVKWTLDQNGFKMTPVNDPILISEKYYHFSTDPRNINNFNLYAYKPVDYKVSGTTIYDSNGKQASDGYYISFINQMNSTDRSTTHTFITYKSGAIIPIIKTDIIISSTGAIQNSIFIR